MEILLVASCYRNRDKLRSNVPLGSYIDFTYLLFYKIPCFQICSFYGRALSFRVFFLDGHYELILESFRPRAPVFGNLRIRNFFFPDLTATVHTDPANSTANPEKKINLLSRVEKNVSATNLITCRRVNPDIFECDDVKSVSSLSLNNKPIWWLT